MSTRRSFITGLASIPFVPLALAEPMRKSANDATSFDEAAKHCKKLVSVSRVATSAYVRFDIPWGMPPEQARDHVKELGFK